MNALPAPVSLAQINAQIAAARPRIPADIAARWADQNATVAAHLRNLARVALIAAEAADRGYYYDTSAEAAVLNAAHDVTQVDALDDMAREIDPGVAVDAMFARAGGVA